MAHGALVVLAIFTFGLLVPSITVPVQDPGTGQMIDQTVNIRPALAIVALILIGFYAGLVKAIGYAITRVIILIRSSSGRLLPGRGSGRSRPRSWLEQSFP